MYSTLHHGEVLFCLIIFCSLICSFIALSPSWSLFFVCFSSLWSLLHVVFRCEIFLRCEFVFRCEILPFDFEVIMFILYSFRSVMLCFCIVDGCHVSAIKECYVYTLLTMSVAFLLYSLRSVYALTQCYSLQPDLLAKLSICTLIKKSYFSVKIELHRLK
jgi:hypothetical protein